VLLTAHPQQQTAWHCSSTAWLTSLWMRTRWSSRMVPAPSQVLLGSSAAALDLEPPSSPLQPRAQLWWVMPVMPRTTAAAWQVRCVLGPWWTLRAWQQLQSRQGSRAQEALLPPPQQQHQQRLWRNLWQQLLPASRQQQHQQLQSLLAGRSSCWHSWRQQSASRSSRQSLQQAVSPRRRWLWCCLVRPGLWSATQSRSGHQLFRHAE
jgi:hypothetical protein